jgi:tetratricopeptide (TPR) repeat protein
MARIERIEGTLYGFTSNKALDLANAQLHLQRAWEADEKEDKDLALELYDQALSCDPTLQIAWVNMGTIWFQRRNYAKAEVCWRHYLAINPKHVLSHFNLANVLEERQCFEEAIQSYLRAITLDPKHGDTHFNLAIRYERAGEYGKSIKHWRLYLRHCGRGEEAWARQARWNIQRLLPKLPLRLIPKSVKSLPRSRVVTYQTNSGKRCTAEVIENLNGRWLVLRRAGHPRSATFIRSFEHIW